MTYGTPVGQEGRPLPLPPESTLSSRYGPRILRFLVTAPQLHHLFSVHEESVHYVTGYPPELCFSNRSLAWARHSDAAARIETAIPTTERHLKHRLHQPWASALTQY